MRVHLAPSVLNTTARANARSASASLLLPFTGCRQSGNPDVRTVAKSCNKRFLWVCLENANHPNHMSSSSERCMHNSRCPACGREKSANTHHPVVHIGRPNLAKRWHPELDKKSPTRLTSGSHIILCGGCASSEDMRLGIPWSKSAPCEVMAALCSHGQVQA